MPRHSPVRLHWLWAKHDNGDVKARAVGITLSLGGVAILAVGCSLLFDLFLALETYPPFGRFPDAVLAVPVTANTEDENFGCTATDINASGRVVGFTNSWNPPSATYSYPRPVVGSAINVDDTDYVDLTPPLAVAAWPWAINDSGLVVGTYRLSQGHSAVLHAYMIREDGTGFVDVHPEGYGSSAAFEVTSSGMVLGRASSGAVQHPVIFPANGYPLTVLGESYHMPAISAGCDRFVVLSAATEPGGQSVHLLYRVDEATTEPLGLPGVPPGYVTIASIADDGTMVGRYEYGSEYGAFWYRLGSDEAWVIDGDIRSRDQVYSRFGFRDFSSAGTIIGIAYRSTGQSRAAKYVFGIRGVEDVTPGEHSAYSELNAVNEDGWAVGYAGFAYGDENGAFVGVVDRAIAVEVK